MHESVCAEAIAASGAFSEITSTVDVLVQPLSRFTTVKVYVPSALTSVVDAFGVVPAGFPEALVHAYVALPAEEDPVKVTGSSAQLINDGVAMVTLGTVLSSTTVMFPILVQPELLSVMVSVYVPAVVTVVDVCVGVVPAGFPEASVHA